MAREYNWADDTIGAFAGLLIPNYHPELATANIRYVFSDAVPRREGDTPGTAKKVSGFLQFAMGGECDFLIEISLPKWNELDVNARRALVDHLLEYCTGDEDEETGEMKWLIRKPDVMEFASILDRHGSWSAPLQGFVSVAQRLDVSSLEEDPAVVEDLNDVVSSVLS